MTDEEFMKKGIAQLMAERLTKGVPRGAYSNNSFEKAGGAALQDIDVLQGKKPSAYPIIYANPDSADMIYFDTGHEPANNTGIKEVFHQSSELYDGKPVYRYSMPFKSNQWDAIIEFLKTGDIKLGDNDPTAEAQLRKDWDLFEEIFHKRCEALKNLSIAGHAYGDAENMAFPGKTLTKDPKVVDENKIVDPEAGTAADVETAELP